MSLSLITLLGNQNPTRDEKYIIRQTIKILQFNKYPEPENGTMRPNSKKHNKILENIISGLRKILNYNGNGEGNVL